MKLKNITFYVLSVAVLLSLATILYFSHPLGAFFVLGT